MNTFDSYFTKKRNSDGDTAEISIEARLLQISLQMESVLDILTLIDERLARIEAGIGDAYARAEKTEAKMKQIFEDLELMTRERDVFLARNNRLMREKAELDAWMKKIREE